MICWGLEAAGSIGEGGAGPGEARRLIRLHFPVFPSGEDAIAIAYR
jgi:hypothetical protein